MQRTTRRSICHDLLRKPTPLRAFAAREGCGSELTLRAASGQALGSGDGRQDEPGTPRQLG